MFSWLSHADSTGTSEFASLKAPLPQTHQLDAIEQTVHIFNKIFRLWRPTGGSADVPTSLAANAAQGENLAILTWNVDFARPNPIRRLEGALAHIEALFTLDSGYTPENTLVLLQEFDQSCFPALLSSPFVRDKYALTDVSSHHWTPGYSYGTLSLIPKALVGRVSSIFRTRFPTSRMGRDALYVDLTWPYDGDTSDAPPRLVRIANVHLESLAGHGDTERKVQLQSVAAYLSCQGVSGGLVAGDMNAISNCDFTLPEDVGLQDVWLLGKPDEEDEKLGHTWGYQPPSKWPARRLDKVLYTGCIKVGKPERVGVGIRVDGAGNLGVDSEKGEWVSDHYGLRTTVEL